MEEDTQVERLEHLVRIMCEEMNETPRAYNLILGPEWPARGPKEPARLYLGTAFSLLDSQLTEQLGGVVSIVAPYRFPRAMLRKVLRTDQELLYLPLEDAEDADISRYFDRAYRFIDRLLRSGRSVLVHCAAGVSRSVTLVAYYLMRRFHITAAEALAYLKQRRCQVEPNVGFLRQLVRAEQELKPGH